MSRRSAGMDESSVMLVEAPIKTAPSEQTIAQIVIDLNDI